MSRRTKKRKSVARSKTQGRIFVFCDRDCKKLIDDINRWVSPMKASEIKIDNRRYLREIMTRRTGGESKTPQIFINSKYIGGYEEVKQLRDKGKLPDLLEACKHEYPGELYEVYRNQQQIFRIRPEKLYFPNPKLHNITTCLKLVNLTDKFGLFKMKTTQPKKYRVKPKSGVVKPNGTVEVKVHLQKRDDCDPVKDKFQLESVATSQSCAKELVDSIFKEIRKTYKSVITCDFGKPPKHIRIIQEKGENIRVEEDESRQREEVLRGHSFPSDGPATPPVLRGGQNNSLSASVPMITVSNGSDEPPESPLSRSLTSGDEMSKLRKEREEKHRREMEEKKRLEEEKQEEEERKRKLREAEEAEHKRLQEEEDRQRKLREEEEEKRRREAEARRKEVEARQAREREDFERRKKEEEERKRVEAEQLKEREEKERKEEEERKKKEIEHQSSVASDLMGLVDGLDLSSSDEEDSKSLKKDEEEEEVISPKEEVEPESDEEDVVVGAKPDDDDDDLLGFVDKIVQDDDDDSVEKIVTVPEEEEEVTVLQEEEEEEVRGMKVVEEEEDEEEVVNVVQDKEEKEKEEEVEEMNKSTHLKNEREIERQEKEIRNLTRKLETAKKERLGALDDAKRELGEKKEELKKMTRENLRLKDRLEKARSETQEVQGRLEQSGESEKKMKAEMERVSKKFDKMVKQKKKQGIDVNEIIEDLENEEKEQYSLKALLIVGVIFFMLGYCLHS